MKSLAFRFLLLFGLVAILFSAFVLYRAHTVSQRHVRELLNQQMALAMEFNLAIRDYAGGQIRPAIEQLVGKDEFHPETMSTSFISRQIFERVRKNFPDCIIRFASDDPRNPINQASPDEHQVIEYFRQNPGAKPRVQEIQIEGQRYLAHFTPRWMKAECLRCHGEPKDAPAAMLARYGDKASFHRKVGEIMALDTVAVPLDKMNAALTAETRWQSLVLAAGLILLFGAVIVVFRFVVTRRLAAMASHFHEIAAQPESGRLVPLPVVAKDEIGLVGSAFNQLVDHLRDAQTLLEERVQQRTADLASANEELRREISERQRAEAALRQRANELAALNVLGRAVNATLSLEQTTKSGLAGMLSAVQPDLAFLFLREGDRLILKDVLPAGGRTLLGDIPEHRVGECMCGLAVREGKALYSRDIFKDRRCTWEECKKAGLKSFAALPLSSGPEVIGVIGLACGTERDFEGQGDFLETLANQVSIALANARLYEAARSELAERKRGEEALREHRDKLDSILRAAPTGIGVVCNRILTEVNERICEMTGYSREELLNQSSRLLYPSDAEFEFVGEEKYRQIKAFGTGTVETRWQRKDGTILEVLLSSTPVHAEDWSAGVTFTALDITGRKQSEAAIRQRGEDLTHLLEVSKTLAITLDLKTVLQAGADGASRLLGLGSAAIYLQEGEWLHLWATTPPLPPEMPDSFRHALLADHPRVQEALTTGRPVLLPDTASAELTPAERAINEARGLRTLVFLPLVAGEQTLGTLIVGALDTPQSVSEAQIDLGRTLANLAALAVVNSRLYETGQSHVADLEREVAERKRAEEALRASEDKFSKAFHTSPDAMNINRVADGVYVETNRSFTAITGYAEAEVLGKTSLDLGIWNNPDDRQRLIKGLQEKGEVNNLEVSFRLKDGRVGTGLMSATLLELKGEPHILSITRDITGRKRAEEALRESEERLRLAITAANQGLYDLNVQTGEALVSPEYATMLGYDPATFHETNAAWMERLHPDDHERVAITYRDYVAGKLPHYQVEFRQRTASGGWKWILSLGKIVERDAQGQPLRMLGTHTDITERKRAEEEREKLQSQLTQAQKMESVGRLAGGVAHDFNNMLQVISGNVSLALLDLPADSPVRDSLLEVQKSAQRSADLTRQLLAFARKQTIAPKVLDLNDTVAGMLKMLRRLIGEDIDLSWMPGANLWPVKMDPSQLDQVLANLCVNARDAIGGVGTVTIETTNVTLDDMYLQSHPECVPGDYVMLAVSDTGKGMDFETRSHLFEPFFTTKEQGKGTGLGLATVFGIVRQNLGLISVYSEPGQGTTFKIYLPRAEAQEIAAAAVARKKVLRGTETILLVEDEDQILVLAQRILQQHGYTVLAARSPATALQLARQHSEPIHLLITDVVMPGMNGRELRNQLADLKPGLRCLYMSGYTADVIAHRGVLDEGVLFLQKPFTIESLAEGAREALKQPPES